MSFIRRLFSRPNTEEETPSATKTEYAKPAAQLSDSEDTVPFPRKEMASAIEDSDTIPVPPKSSGTTTRLDTVLDGATRPLPQEKIISTQNEHLTFGQSTDVGMVRTNNQDAVLSFFSVSRSVEDRPDFGLFIVADGMGGHDNGEKASAIASRTLATYVTQKIYLPMLMNKTDLEDRPPITEALIEGVQKANEDVIANVPGGGTTMTTVVVVGDLAYIGHVGDTRTYIITKEGMEQITRDHSLVQRLKELDQLTDEEMIDHPQRNYLYRALGQSENLEVDSMTRRLQAGSRMLICSDGLWGYASEAEILEVVMSHSNPQEACDKLVALANRNGGQDNITAIILKIPS